MIISDDEDGSASEQEKRKKSKKAPKVQSRKKASKASSESSDYEGSAAEDSDSDSAVVDESSSISDAESTAPKRITSKAKAAPPSKSSRKKSETLSSDGTTDNDDMDVDDVPTKGKKVTKRKATDNDERPTKKQKRANSDPWKLESKAAQKDWTKMQAPPLEMFHFARKVVDEYTYLDGKIHALVTRLTAERHWVLSGTPPIHDFGALKTIAAFLNLHLGVDDDAEGRSAEVKKRRKEQTGT